MIGGEAEASAGWLKFGQWYAIILFTLSMDFLVVPFSVGLPKLIFILISSRYKWAEQHGAALFQLEHR